MLFEQVEDVAFDGGPGGFDQVVDERFPVCLVGAKDAQGRVQTDRSGPN